jgi:ribose transport system ATP-binding protein
MGLEFRQISKSYSGVSVLEGVDLTVADGEIHALLGANGAGKSTLIKCISGATRPDSGTILVNDAEFLMLTPKQARAIGVAVIYQELSLAMSLRIYENVFLGQELRRGPFIKRRAERRETARWLAQLDVSLDPSQELDALGNAELQIVEVVKALQADAKVLILDEPTSSLTERETRQLMTHLKSLKTQQLPILYVTHRLGEVFELADRVTVLRGGEVVVPGDKISEMTREDLVDAISARKVSAAASRAADNQRPAAISADGILAPGIGPIDLTVREGETLGVFGLVGSGRTELLETLFGARRRYGGSISIGGQVTAIGSPGDAVAAGIALVPSDRRRRGIFRDLSAGDNMLLRALRRLSWFGIRRFSREADLFHNLADQLDLQPRRRALDAQSFSGGNQQKLVLGRWLQDSQHCRVLLLDEPTEGVDVGARQDLYETLRAFCATGSAVVLTSSEPEELLQVVDRVIVLSHGRAVANLARGEITERRLLELAHLGEDQTVG